jgi:hypothetical protein
MVGKTISAVKINVRGGDLNVQGKVLVPHVIESDVVF